MWHFGYKAHIGVDKNSGLLDTIKTTVANQHDVTVTSELVTGEEEQVYGDSGYLGADKRPEAKKKNNHGKRIQYKINRRPSQSKTIQLVHNPKSSAANTRSHLFVQKWNMSLRSRNCNFGS